MPNILNYTPFSATTFGVLDNRAHQYNLVVISATFEALPSKPVQLADIQLPVYDSDVYYGQPGSSSIRYEGEIALQKPFVDVLVNGSAYAPLGRKAERVTVSLRVGDINKVLQVSGDRKRRTGLFGATTTSPSSFETMPIVWERAFGGSVTEASNPNKCHVDPRNPIGIGFQGALSSCHEIKTEIPNIEYFSQSLEFQETRSEPAGLGTVCRYWQPRAQFAGSYDDEWKAKQWPLLPLNFDNRHYQTAPVDQQSTTIQGGESVEIINMTPEGKWQFTLPIIDIPLRLWPPIRGDAPTFRMDTVILEPDTYRIILVARAKIPVLRNRAPLEEIILGHVSSAWWRARLKGKIYLDRAGMGVCSMGFKDFIV
jgi:hypothetical protein